MFFTKTRHAPGVITIPRQRGTGRGSQPLIVVVEQAPPSLSARASRAAGRWAWRHRRHWAPTGLAVAAWLAAGIAHLIAPAAAWWLSPLLLAPAGVWQWVSLRRRTTFRSTRLWRAALAALATALIGWLLAAILVGPARPSLALAWLALTCLVQTLWLLLRPSNSASSTVSGEESSR
ncbi:hypothetical protein ACFYZT_12080 [Streptomyces sp. NPDC001591]|uniref:hypothetical protein n=1 Tax=Streptomyces sp. NPDC001591 TaxID=3364589 RepID=UPI0036A68862